MSHLCSESVDAVVLNNHATCVELAKGGQNIPFAYADVPKLACHFGSPLPFLSDLGNEQDKTSIGAEAK